MDRQHSTVSTSTVLQPADSGTPVASPNPGGSLQRLVTNQGGLASAPAAAVGPVRRSSRGRASRRHAAPVSPSPALAASPVSVPRLLPPAAVPASSLLALPALLPGLQGKQHQHGPSTVGSLLGSGRSSSGTLRLPRLLPLAMLQDIDSACAGAPAAAAGFALPPSAALLSPPARATTAPPAGIAWDLAAAGCAPPFSMASRQDWEPQATATPGSTSTRHSFLQSPFAPGPSSASRPALQTAGAGGVAGMAAAAPTSLGSSSSRKRSAALASPAAGGWGDGQVPVLSGPGSNKRRTSMGGFGPAVPQPHEVAVSGSGPVLTAQHIIDLDAVPVDHLQHTPPGLYASWAAAYEPVAAQRQHSTELSSRSATSPGIAAAQAVAAHEEELLQQVLCFCSKENRGCFWIPDPNHNMLPPYKGRRPDGHT